MRRFLPTGSTLLALACGIGFAVGGWRAGRAAAPFLRPAGILQFLPTPVPAPGATDLTFVFLFRPAECPRLMSIIETLNDIAASEGRVVGALTVEEYRFPAWRDLARAEGIRFPVTRLHPLLARLALHPLGYGDGPLLVVLDGTGRVVHASNALAQRELPALLAQLIRIHHPAASGGSLADR